MKIGHDSPMDLNVRIVVAKEDGTVVRESRFKNTATQRMTDSIALFLAGDTSTYARDTASAPRGKWRPNFVSFGTTGIDAQPTQAQGLATVLDRHAFENKCPEPGDRDRPWFYSNSIGAHYDRFWNPCYGWGNANNPDVACFSGELITDNTPVSISQWNEQEQERVSGTSEEPQPWTTIRRLSILRADVTIDNLADRQVAQDGYGTDVIFYSYASVLWLKQFFEPTYGPAVPRIAISEFGLYELDSNTEVGRNSLLAGFRVPTIEDIIYVDPDEVVLVEWRVSIRALMPYEGVVDTYELTPTGVSVDATEIDEKNVQLHAVVHGPSLIPQSVLWSMTGAEDSGTTLSQTGLLHIAQHEPASLILVKAASTKVPQIYSVAAVLTGLIKNMVTGVSVSVVSTDVLEIQLQAAVLGRGNITQNVTWTMTGAEDPGTTIDSTGLIHIAFEEHAEELTVTATSVDDNQIFSVAAVVLIDKTSGSYTISDFSILT
jgi:hypothetical protein